MGLWRLAAPVLALLAVWGRLGVRSQESTAQTDDITLLLELRNSIENWQQFSTANSITGWSNDVPVCVWGGITCSEEGRVQTLSLQCNNCSVQAVGTLPDSLGQMSALATLNLQGNLFYGTLPTLWGGPDAFTVLQNMYLNDNNLTGLLPESWGAEGALANLLLLRLDSNHLGGTLPASWGLQGRGMQALLVLRLFNNSIGGPLPDQWGHPQSFSRLQIMALQHNQLTGSVPEVWWTPGSLPSLQELYLQTNRLVGALPPSPAWSTLQYLNMSRNALGGTLPPEWGRNGSFPSLKVMAFNDTQLTGTLPPEWGAGSGFPSLDALWLENNNLSGTIPPEWADLAALKRLIIKPGNPDLCGPAPTDLPFSLCDEGDPSCLRVVPALDGPNCPQGPTPESIPDGSGTGTGQPAAPPSSTSGASEGGGGSTFPVAAVAAPVAVVAAGAAALGLFVAWRRRKRRREEEAAKVAEASPSDRPFYTEGGHPFDTQEGRDRITSPFALATVQETGASSDSRQQSSSGGFGWGGGAGSTGRRHDTVRTHSSASSYLAACARIRTKSLDNLPEGAMPPGEVQLTAQGSGAAGRNSGTPMQDSGTAAQNSGVALPPPEDILAMMSGLPSSALQTDVMSSGDTSRAFSTDLPWSDWEIKPDEIEIMKRPDGSEWELGSGGFGKVCKALRNGVQPVAVKVLSASSDLRAMALAEFRKEIAILKACRDVNIVQFVGAHLGPERTMLVTEYMEGGNLASNISAGRVSWYRRGRKIALDVAKGLVFLHSKRIVHFDLKSPNILLARDGTAKIADVGMAKILNRDYVTGVVGTLAWAAPEMLWGERCTEKADMYSYGIVLWEICTGERPVRGQLRDVRVPEECPAEVRQLVLECLETRPSRRPSALQVVQRLNALPAILRPGLAISLPDSAGPTPASPLSQPPAECPPSGAQQQQAQQAQQQQQQAQQPGPSPVPPRTPGRPPPAPLRLPVSDPLIMGDVGVVPGAHRSNDISHYDLGDAASGTEGAAPAQPPQQGQGEGHSAAWAPAAARLASGNNGGREPSGETTSVSFSSSSALEDHSQQAKQASQDHSGVDSVALGAGAVPDLSLPGAAPQGPPPSFWQPAVGSATGAPSPFSLPSAQQQAPFASSIFSGSVYYPHHPETPSQQQQDQQPHGSGGGEIEVLPDQQMEGAQ